MIATDALGTAVAVLGIFVVILGRRVIYWSGVLREQGERLAKLEQWVNDLEGK